MNKRFLMPMLLAGAITVGLGSWLIVRRAAKSEPQEKPSIFRMQESKKGGWPESYPEQDLR